MSRRRIRHRSPRPQLHGRHRPTPKSIRLPHEERTRILRQSPRKPTTALPSNPRRRQSLRQDPADRQFAGEGEQPDHLRRHGVYIQEDTRGRRDRE